MGSEMCIRDRRSLIEYPWADKVVESRLADAAAIAAQDPQDVSPLGPAVMRFDTLVTGESNSVAAQLARDIAKGGHLPVSVVVINGRQGVGKTHIMKALEAELDGFGGRSVAYISAEEFYVAYVEGVMNGDTRALKTRVRKADIVLFDDCLLYTSPSPRDRTRSRMPSSA